MCDLQIIDADSPHNIATPIRAEAGLSDTKLPVILGCLAPPPPSGLDALYRQNCPRSYREGRSSHGS
jgi:hypothetical protein